MAVSRRSLIRAAAGLPLLGLLPACEGPAAPSSFKGIDITGAEYAQDLDLPGFCFVRFPSI